MPLTRTRPFSVGRFATVLLFGVAVGRAAVVSTEDSRNSQAASARNPVAPTQESLTAGKRAYDTYCAACHGSQGQGAVKAGTPISIIAEQGGKQPPDLTDDQWDHGSTDGEIFTVIKRGVPPTMMAGWGGQLSDTEIWNVVNYLRALAAHKGAPAGPGGPPEPAAAAGAGAGGGMEAAAGTGARAADGADRGVGARERPGVAEGVRGAPRPRLELADYVQLPITADNRGDNTRLELARINFMRDEPGGHRFFINDLNGPLYVLDKQTKQLATYLDFNGAGGRRGLFRKLTFERNYATGLINVIFDPDYAHNGVFYTIHMEDPTIEGSAAPRTGVVPGLDVSGYTVTPAIRSPTAPGAVINREAVLIEWTDRDTSNATFEGTAREILRLQLQSPIHPLGDFTFNPAARPGDPEWRVMYLGAGDSGTGEQRDARSLVPQRLDTLNGKILRIIPDLREHAATSRVSDNGRYRIPDDNPFVSVGGARKEIWAVGLRNPHRLTWYVDPEQPVPPRLFAFNIGLASWETAMFIARGANYGYPLREGPQARTAEGMGPVPADDVIPWQVTLTETRGGVKPTYPVIAYPHTPLGGDAIAGGFIYRGSAIPALKGRMLLGDITTGRIWYADMKDVLAADDDDPTTVATLHEVDAGLRRLVEETFHARGGHGDSLPGTAAVAGRGRVDLRFAEDSQGELYVLTKSDGMIRRIVGFK